VAATLERPAPSNFGLSLPGTASAINIKKCEIINNKYQNKKRENVSHYQECTHTHLCIHDRESQTEPHLQQNKKYHTIFKPQV
jgi:hypothetical protein